MPKITLISFQIIFELTLKILTYLCAFLPFSPCNQGDWKMCLIELSKVSYSFQIIFKLGTRITTCVLFLLFSPCKQGDWKMCLIELYKVTYSFHILFKFGAKITIYLCAFLLIFPIKDFILTLGSLSIQGMQIYGTSPFASADFKAFSTMWTHWFWGPELLGVWVVIGLLTFLGILGKFLKVS